MALHSNSMTQAHVTACCSIPVAFLLQTSKRKERVFSCHLVIFLTPAPSLPAVGPFVLLDLGTTAGLLIPKAQRDWERVAGQHPSQWGLSRSEREVGPVIWARALQ